MLRSFTRVLPLVTTFLLCRTVAGGDVSLVAFPESNTTVSILRKGEPYLEVEFVGWGPGWSWLGFRGTVQEKNGESVLRNSGTVKTSGAQLTLIVRVKKSGPRQLRLAADLRTSKDTPLTCVVAAVGMAGKPFTKGRIVAVSTKATTKEVTFPLEKKGLGDSVQQFTAVDSRGRPTRFTLMPACSVPTDGAARVFLAGAMLKEDAPATVTMTIDLPEECTYYPSGNRVPRESGSDAWFTFKPDQDYDTPSELDMGAWLEAPAGKHGRITRKGDDLLYNAKPMKLWGLNLCYGTCAPEKELAEKRAKFYARYGINAVRLHKYADGAGWAGIQSADSFVEFDPAGLDRLDYFVAQLKKRGIYVKFSAHFGSQKLGPADKRYVPYMEELGSLAGRKNRITTPHSAVHYAPELQDVQIRQMVNLLEHKNPYTGLTYADDPAVAFVEIINEQSILFYTSMTPLKVSPTIRRYAAKRFCDWLRQRYGTHTKLLAAWGGEKALNGFENDGFPATGEHLEKNTILPLGNPWYWDPGQLRGSQAYRRQRLLDTLVFLYGLQNEFYSRYVKAMRAAGYQGEIVSSNWQAGRAFSHLLNLHSDSLVGTIDRHNYFGGGSGNRINDATMLSLPGSGTLGAGMQQVADRPFMLSEWIHVTPNEWGVEGPAIIGAYGMGLQGWDVSYMFQNRDSGAFSERIGRERWDVTAPNVLGIFPAVARHILRGDVAEADLRASCYAHVPALAVGKLSFEDAVTQKYDVKTFGTDKVPAATLAVARCAVEFTETYRDTPRFDLSRFKEGEWYRSSTDQLRWKQGAAKLDGCFTMNTAGTKAVVGFAGGQVHELGAITIAPKCRYGAIYLTAKERDRNLATSNKLLVVAVARARNTGMNVFGGTRIVAPGKGPVVMEPVKAAITIRRKGTPTVYLLDHSGRKTERTLPVENGTFAIDGARDKTCYYLVSYEDA